jgi:hypothetical protein
MQPVLESNRSNYDTGSLYRELIGAGILRPVVRHAGSVHYYVQNYENLDAIANSVDVNKTISLFKGVFDGGMPWNYEIPNWAYEGAWNVEKQGWDKVPKSVAANTVQRRASETGAPQVCPQHSVGRDRQDRACDWLHSRCSRRDSEALVLVERALESSLGPSEAALGGGSHTELFVGKNRTGYHNHINLEEVTALYANLP